MCILAAPANKLTTTSGRASPLAGSRVGDIARPASNIDLLANLGPKATFGSIVLISPNDTLWDALSRMVDIAFKGALRAGVETHMTRYACQAL